MRNRIFRRLQMVWITLFIALVITSPVVSSGQDITAEQVRRSLQRGTRFLLGSQSKNGSWPSSLDNRFPEGTTALATLALLNCGISPKTPSIQKSIDQILAVPEGNLTTYFTSLRLMVLATADPKGQLYRPEIQNDADWLIANQVSRGAAKGGWSYKANPAMADSSNSQYALLALHEANQVGAKIPKDVWEMAKKYWSRAFDNRNGGFGYDVSAARVNAAMTCAGISSLIIAEENLANIEGLVDGGEVVCCRPIENSDQLNRAIAWMGKKFSVQGNPDQRRTRNKNGKYYFLYGMERAGRLSGRRFFGAHDWYREGADALVQSQKTNGSWVGEGFSEEDPNISTSFSLLFLSKGKRPIVMGKYKFGPGNDWNRHPRGVHYLTKNLEQQWKTKLNWQTIDGNDATVYDLAESPILFISGRDQLDLTTAQKKELKDYIENGNFIFAEANQGNGCWENVKFDRKFRQLMAELFPDTDLKPLSLSHPIWNAHFSIRPDPKFPVLGLQACCRTSVVYCPQSLSGHWQLSRKQLLDQLPGSARPEVKYATELGINVASYATGRQLRDKLDLPDVRSQAVSVLTNRALVLPKLQHRGGADDAPNAWRNVLRRMDEFGLTVDLERKMISPVPEQLFDHPFIFVHGRNEFFFKNAEVEALTNYVKGGNRGFIFADAICSSKAFRKAFSEQIVRIVPGSTLEPIPSDHPIWSNQYGGFDIQTVTITKPDRTKPSGFATRKVAPQFYGIEIEGRLVVVYSPLDLSCALENATRSHCEGYTR
ncbi:MAG: DUF4159 domain-containing protein, partial [Planctomycetota bacterium]